MTFESAKPPVNPPPGRLPVWLLAVVPLVLFAAASAIFISLAPLERLAGDLPPIEDLTVTRTELREGTIILHLVNGGQDPVTIAQVLVDDAYWEFTMQPESHTMSRLQRGTIMIPYNWVDGEAHEIMFLSSTGVTFEHRIELAVATPEADGFHWIVFALVGLFVGVVPVGLGLMWFPLLRRLSADGLRFVLALTVGLLFFLLVDTVHEGLEIAEVVSEAFHAVPLVFLVTLLSLAALMVIGNRPGVRDKSTSEGRFWIATAIAIGIGFHNFGEGMAIGAATALGEVALGTFLVMGFALHNITEGIGIGAPMARDSPSVKRLVWLALLAGAPAIPGIWIGGFSFSPLLAVIFLSIGAGAILQVIFEVGRMLVPQPAAGTPLTRSGVLDWVNIGGVSAGVAIMYVTALLVA